MEELKPCPFCGSKYTQVRYMGVKWQEPIAFSNGYRGECCGCYTVTAAYDTEAEAIDAWNSRAERTCKQEERGWGTEGDHARVWLTCGHDCMVPTVQDLPNYCPNCGAKVVEG